MQKIYTNQTLLMVTHIRNLLENAGIDSELRNEFAAGGVGELSFIDAWPELWVDYPDVALARQIITGYETATLDAPEWQCRCGEWNGSAFMTCWSCQANKRHADQQT